MAILVRTDRPQALLNAIKRGIRHGEIDTWAYDKDGDFTHLSRQWCEKAWLHPMPLAHFLRVGVIWPEGSDQDSAIAAVYYGHFIEMLLTHFSANFERVIVPPLST